MSAHDQHKIYTIIDKLTLESLSLMEQHIRTKIQLEKCMIDGESNLAKARYIMGHKQVSELQLPSEDYNEFDARCVVNHYDDNADMIKNNFFDLELREIDNQSDNYDKAEVINPIKWFGVLVPRSLHLAQNNFKQTLYWSIKCVNIQRKLSDCLRTLGKLNNLIEL